METHLTKVNQDKRKYGVYTIIENAVVFLGLFVFAGHYTIVGTTYGSLFAFGKNIFMIAILLLFAYKFFTVTIEERKSWFTTKAFILSSFVWLLAFFIFRWCTFIKGGFTYYTAREIFFEFAFLVAICNWTVDKKVKLKLFLGLFVVLNLIVNILDSISVMIITSAIRENSYGYIAEFLMSLSSYQKFGVANIMYSNPNTGGIFTALAMLLSLLFIKRKKSVITGCAVYWIYSIYKIWYFSARAAMVSLLVSGLCILLMMSLKKIRPAKLAAICLALSALVNVGLYGVINHNLSDGDKSFTRIEQQINGLSASRYQIWQDCVIAHEKDMIFGVGSAPEEMDERNQYLEEQYYDSTGTLDGFLSNRLSMHNGYLAVLFIAGWIGFILFIIIMVDKILSSQALKPGNGDVERWQPVVFSAVIIFCLMICHFEAMLVTSRYFTWLCIVIILAWDVSEDEEECGGTL